jgi:hypothetical protein
MNEFFLQVQQLIASGEVIASKHAQTEMAVDGILIDELIIGVESGEVVEHYPNYPKGPCVLVLQQDANGNPVHALWGIGKGKISPVVLITVYRPDPGMWTGDFLRRQP